MAYIWPCHAGQPWSCHPHFPALFCELADGRFCPPHEVLCCNCIFRCHGLLCCLLIGLLYLDQDCVYFLDTDRLHCRRLGSQVSSPRRSRRGMLLCQDLDGQISTKLVQRTSKGDGPRETSRGKVSHIADVPTVTHIGSCGLPIRTERRACGETYTRRFVYDINGNKTRDIDSHNRIVTKMVYNNLGHLLQKTVMDEGESWSLQDSQGGDLLSWNCRGYSFKSHYDALGRETERLAQNSAEAPKSL